MNLFKVEVNYVASISNKYMAEKKDNKANDSGKTGNSVEALIYIVSSDLLPMLMATGHKIDRLPIVYLAEAHA